MSKLGVTPDMAAIIAKRITNAVNGELNAGAAGAESAGANMGSGFVRGLSSKRRAIEATAGDLARVANRAFEAVEQISSPSRKWRWYGNMDGEGLVLGLLDKRQKVAEASARLSLAGNITAPRMDASGILSQANSLSNLRVLPPIGADVNQKIQNVSNTRSSHFTYIVNGPKVPSLREMRQEAERLEQLQRLMEA
jgi:hypothetical protein